MWITLVYIILYCVVVDELKEYGACLAELKTG